MVKKAFKPENYWASRIVRVIKPSGENICGLVFRRYSDTDVERTGLGTWIGLQEVPEYPFVTDMDEDSETFGKRVEDRSGEPINIKHAFTEEWDKTSIEKYKKMVGETALGRTQLIYRIGGKAYEAENPDEFWSATKKEIQDKYTSKLQKIVIEKTAK